MEYALNLPSLERLEVDFKADREEFSRRLVRDHVDFVWRTVRRLGVPERELEDAVQEVFMVALRRWTDSKKNPKGFLFYTAVNVAAHARRSRARRHESGEEPSEEQIDPALLPDQQLELERARALLVQVLDRLPLDLRTVFMLYELEQMTMAEIAELTRSKPGTVASRLRRAREQFFSCVHRIEAARRRQP